MDGSGGLGMRIWSDDFEQGGPIPKLHTCDGRDMSPHLAWEGVPPGTMSLALIVDDPDAPGGTWVHWLVCDIAPGTTSIPRGVLPQGARQSRNDFGKLEYGGPCPPGGTHRYFHRLYALNVPRLEGATDKRAFYQLVERHRLAQAELMGTYKRSRW